MKIDILTLFPEMVDNILSESIIGRARANNKIEINCINIRDFSKDKHRRVDDYPYGGGMGMVMQPQPIYDAYKSIVDKSETKPVVIYMSPQGRVFNQEIAKELANLEHIVLLCGHYEGVDERIIEEIVDFELSIGDYVLTGGELPAAVVADCVARLVPGVLSDDMSFIDESHYNNLLEYPQYTRPPEFMGRKVPEVLLSGHHKNIEAWREEQSFKRTKIKRPDLIGGKNE
ncbi:MAG: tRNA (guanosine(37)-N1)-methyltransferase TrmD [Clostridia bacterium]|nr:tRNA (guanosine(37)-N1)-methyltransferase TrmD [Clostridia bacterium]